LWVILQQSLHIVRLPGYDEEVTLRSIPGKPQHVFFPRFYEVISGGETIVSGDALWLLINEKTRHLVFPEQEGISLPGLENKKGHLRPAAVRGPEGAVRTDCGILTAPFSMADLNGHINNAKYFDILDDHLDLAEASRAPREMFAEYAREIRVGEKFRFVEEKAGNVRYFEGLPIEETPAGYPPENAAVFPHPAGVRGSVTTVSCPA